MYRVQIVKFASILTADKTASKKDYTNLETYSIVWLDPLVTDNKEYVDAQQRLRLTINCIRTLKTIDDCERYLQQVPEQDRVIFIVNHQLGQEIIPRVHSFPQICGIYIHINDQKRNLQWTKEFIKVTSSKKN